MYHKREREEPVVLAADPSFFGKRRFPYYRLYLLTPGMLNTFGIADTGGYGPAQNLEAILPTIPQYQDEVLHGFLKDQMQRNADGFYQQVGWGLLWYDPTVGDKDLRDLQTKSWSVV